MRRMGPLIHSIHDQDLRDIPPLPLIDNGGKYLGDIGRRLVHGREAVTRLSFKLSAVPSHYLRKAVVGYVE
jgi:hypothetical protein